MDRVSRRGFVKRSGKALAGVTAGLTVISRAKSAFAANDEIGVAVMGIHGRGRSHIDAWAKMDGVRVVALVDPDESLFESRAKQAEDKQGSRPKCYADIRECLRNPDVDAVSIATCNHWHALGTIWACQAGKDVYVEKPASHNVFEGRKMVEAARKYERMVQVGQQNRSSGSVRNAIARLWAGQIGEVHMSRGLCYKTRRSIGFKTEGEPPQNVNFDLWLGPATLRPFHGNLVHYNWHWFWEFGNGDIGNQGVHQMDIARWVLGQGLPVKVSSMGGRYGYEDQGETPNTQVATFQYEDGKMLVFEVRGLPTNDELGAKVGNLAYGANGYMSSGDGWKPRIGYGGDGEPPEDLELPEVGGTGEGGIFGNFINAVRSRRWQDLDCDVEQGHLSAALCHLANIAFRLGRTLTFDPETETFPGDDEANAMLTRDYREPFVVPEEV
ncbi:MAG: Gfo/Idh/MocA family protein [Armatimonadota bacterium]